jgi:hypothetical protein
MKRQKMFVAPAAWAFVALGSISFGASNGNATDVAERVVRLTGPVVPHTVFQANGTDPPCGAIVNGAVLPPGYASCANNFCVALPGDVGEVTKITMVASDRFGERECIGGNDCGIGWSKFWSSPEQHPDKICGHFKNWSHDRDRTPAFLVSYRPRG